MSYELISEAEYADLPADEEQCFVAFETICRKNMTRIIDASKNGYTAPDVRSQYMASVAAVARECGIPNIEVPSYDEEHAYDAFLDFRNAVSHDFGA